MTELSEHSGVLTHALVASKNKCDNLENIKNLNLWGNQLEDLKLLRQMPNLEVVSLSVNSISTLKEFSFCAKLQELYLRKNNIEDIKEIRYLFKLPNLKVLWLHDNPCANTPNYRQIVIRYLPRLTKLDNTPISNEQRNEAQKVNLNFDEGDFQFKSINKNIENQKPISFHIQPLSEKRMLSNRSSHHQTIQTSDKKHILDAILLLYKELDTASLESARNQCDKLLKLRRK